jgi:hypothetical protein
MLSGGGVDEPDVGFPVLAHVAFAVDVDGRQAGREDIVTGLGDRICVHDSHCSTVPVMCSDRGMAGPMRAPRRVCTRIQGSNGDPSGRVQRA